MHYNGRRKRKTSRFVPSRVYIREATKHYLSEGGRITILKLSDITPEFPVSLEEISEFLGI